MPTWKADDAGAAELTTTATVAAVGGSGGADLRRRLCVALAGGTAFLGVYVTQPLLPALRTQFGVGEAAVAATISALTFAIALAAPVVGPLGDFLAGRKRLIVSAVFVLAILNFLAARSHSLSELLSWRFAQGLAVPAVLASTLAYIAEEFPAAVNGRAMGAYIGGNVLGGFLGRFMAGLVAGDEHDWQRAFLLMGALSVAGGATIWAVLPPSSSRGLRSMTGVGKGGAGVFHGMAGSLRALPQHARNPTLLATYAVGASVLFSLTATFTFATFYFHDRFGLSAAQIGAIFFVYLAGVVATPLSGRFIDRHGHRRTVLASLLCSAVGLALTLVAGASILIFIAGLALTAVGAFISQAASQGFVGQIAREGRGAAAGLYLSAYYLGGG
ncbi:MAG: MFS transporter, partial [Verrucomicrobia bacterium]|nr:MFS transporter [Verrucomicrobiota bacterium]